MGVVFRRAGARTAQAKKRVTTQILQFERGVTVHMGTGASDEEVAISIKISFESHPWRRRLVHNSYLETAYIGGTASGTEESIVHWAGTQ